MRSLDERKAAILRAIVEQYVAAAAPVGSQTVTQTAGLGVSAATVRNEMSVLESEGYIAQPHTSAGRVPTDRGYRYFVDHLAGAPQLPGAERRRIAEFFTSATLAMDELLSQTSQLLAGLTAHAAVVVGPETQAVTVRAAQLVPPHDGHGDAVITWPSSDRRTWRTSPVPPHPAHCAGWVPGAQPDAPQSSHSTGRSSSRVLCAPNTTSSRVSSTGYSAS